MDSDAWSDVRCVVRCGFGCEAELGCSIFTTLGCGRVCTSPPHPSPPIALASASPLPSGCHSWRRDSGQCSPRIPAHAPPLCPVGSACSLDNTSASPQSGTSALHEGHACRESTQCGSHLVSRCSICVCGICTLRDACVVIGGVDELVRAVPK